MSESLYVNDVNMLIYKGNYNNLTAEAIENMVEVLFKCGDVKLYQDDGQVYEVCSFTKKNIVFKNKASNDYLVAGINGSKLIASKTTVYTPRIDANRNLNLNLFNNLALIVISNSANHVGMVVIVDNYGKTDDYVSFGCGDNIIVEKRTSPFGVRIINNNSFPVYCEVI